MNLFDCSKRGLLSCAVCLLLIALFSPLTLRAGDFDYLSKGLYRNNIQVLSSPLKWNKNERIVALSFLGASVLSYSNDEEIQELYYRYRGNTSNRIAGLVRPLGGKLVMWNLAGILAAGHVFKDQKLRETAYMGIQSVLITQQIVQGLKSKIGRARPFAGKGIAHFEGTDFSPAGYSLSFPSGHAATAFAFASVIAHQYPQLWVKIVVYTLATGVAWSRLNDNVHFTSDVVVGAGIGLFIGSSIVKNHTKNYPSKY